MDESRHDPSTPASQESTTNGLDSWKEIAAYLKRNVSTVQRWEKREGMPVHRHQHDKLDSVYAFRSEIPSDLRADPNRLLNQIGSTTQGVA